MKLSIEQANKYLSSLGSPVQIVGDDDADKDPNIDEAVTEFNDDIKAEIKKDKEFTASLVAAAGSQAKGAMMSAVARALGISKKELDGIDSYDDIIKKGKELYDLKNGATKAEWETERAKLIQEHEAEIADWESKVTAKDTELATANTTWQNKYDDHFINNSFIEAMNKAPKKSGDIVELADTARYRLGKDYDFKFNHEKKAMEAFTKDGKPVKDFDINTHINTFLEKQGIKATDMRDAKPANPNPNYTPGVVTTATPKNLNPMFAGIAGQLQAQE